MAKKSAVKKVAAKSGKTSKAIKPVKKTIEQRYFEFLKELQEYSKVGGFKSFAPLIKKHGISKNVSTVLLTHYTPKLIIKEGSKYEWISLNPTMDMAIALVKDVKKYTDKSKAKKTAPKKLEVGVFTENVSVPQQIIHDVNINKSEIIENIEPAEPTKNPDAEKVDVEVFTKGYTVDSSIIEGINSKKIELVEVQPVLLSEEDNDKLSAALDKLNLAQEELQREEEYKEKISDLEKEIKTLEYSKENIALTHRKLLFDMDSPDYLIARLCTLDNHEEAIKNSPFYAKEIKKLEDKIEQDKEYIYELKTEVKSLNDDKNELEAIIEVIKCKWRFRFLQFITGRKYFKKITKKAYLKLALRNKFIMPNEGKTTIEQRIEIARTIR